MNSKKAKALRRRAQDATVGQQRAVYRDRWFQRAYEVLAITGEMETRTYYVYTRSLIPDCTRAVYQRLKVAA